MIEDHEPRYVHYEVRRAPHRSAESEWRRARAARIEAERELARARSAAEEAEDNALDASLAHAGSDPLAAGTRGGRRSQPTTWVDDDRRAGPEVVVTRVSRDDVPYAEPCDTWTQPVLTRPAYDLPTCEPVAVYSTSRDPWATRQTTRGRVVVDAWGCQPVHSTEVILGPTCAPTRSTVVYRRPVYAPAPCAPVIVRRPAPRVVVCEPIPSCEPVVVVREPRRCAPAPVVVYPRRCAPAPVVVYQPRRCEPVCAPRSGWGVSVGVGHTSSYGSSWSGRSSYRSSSCGPRGGVSVGVGTSFQVGGVSVGFGTRW